MSLKVVNCEQLEAGQVKMQSRLEEEEQAKAALMSRIQRLTKLILVSTKNAIPTNLSDIPAHQRRHSFGEDEVITIYIQALQILDASTDVISQVSERSMFVF